MVAQSVAMIDQVNNPILRRLWREVKINSLKGREIIINLMFLFLMKLKFLKELCE